MQQSRDQFLVQRRLLRFLPLALGLTLLCLLLVQYQAEEARQQAGTHAQIQVVSALYSDQPALHIAALLLELETASDDLAGRFVQTLAQLGEWLEALEQQLPGAAPEALLDAYRQQRSLFLGSLSRTATLLRSGQREDASALLHKEGLPAWRDTHTALLGLIDWQLQQQHLAVEAANSRERLMRWLLGLALLQLLLIVGVRGRLRRVSGARQDMEDPLVGQTDASEPRVLESQRYAEMLASVPDWLWEADSHWNFTYVGPQCRALLGYEPEELLGQSVFSVMASASRSALNCRFDDAKAAEQPLQAIESPCVHRDGHIVILETTARPFYSRQGELLGYRGTDREVTERKISEDVREKQSSVLREALLREVHHRVKNNLQSVVALLQQACGRHPALGSELQSAVSRVHSVAVLHGIYGSLGTQSLSLESLLRGVHASVVELSGCKLQLGDTTAIRQWMVRDADAAVLALILNEIMTNACKHACDQTAPPELQILARPDECELRLGNVGQLSAQFDFAAGRGLGNGLELVRALLPERGLQLVYEAPDGRVEVQLLLYPPLLYLHDGSASPGEKDIWLSDRQGGMS